jgi:hypothetical protein
VTPAPGPSPVRAAHTARDSIVARAEPQCKRKSPRQPKPSGVCTVSTRPKRVKRTIAAAEANEKAPEREDVYSGASLARARHSARNFILARADGRNNPNTRQLHKAAGLMDRLGLSASIEPGRGGTLPDSAVIRTERTGRRHAVRLHSHSLSGQDPVDEVCSIPPKAGAHARPVACGPFDWPSLSFNSAVRSRGRRNPGDCGA